MTANPERRCHVLLVEDDATLRKLAAAFLRTEGYEVVEADSGLAAVAWLDEAGGTGSAATPLDLAIIDVVMPNMSGPKTAQLLRERRPGLRILFFSGYTDESMADVESDELKAGFLQKPFTRHTLLTTVADALVGTGGDRGADIKDVANMKTDCLKTIS